MSTLQRFESSGRITLDNLLKLAAALGRLGELDKLFQPPLARSLDELEQRTTVRPRKRGRT